MKKIQLGLIALLLGAIAPSAMARDSIGFSLNIGVPYVYAPPAVYYAPPPVVYYEPRWVYREHYTPNTYYSNPYHSRYDHWKNDRHEHWKNGHGYNRHHKHWKRHH